MCPATHTRLLFGTSKNALMPNIFQHQSGYKAGQAQRRLVWETGQVGLGREHDVRVRGYEREGTEKVVGKMRVRVCVCVCVCVCWNTETMIKIQAWGVSGTHIGRLMTPMWAETETKLAGTIQTGLKGISKELILQVL